MFLKKLEKYRHFKGEAADFEDALDRFKGLFYRYGQLLPEYLIRIRRDQSLLFFLKIEESQTEAFLRIVFPSFNVVKIGTGQNFAALNVHHNVADKNENDCPHYERLPGCQVQCINSSCMNPQFDRDLREIRHRLRIHPL